MILTSSIMYVQFKAAIVNLSVRYSVRCAAIFQNNSGLNFGSVDRDNDGSYEHNSDCSWTILVEPFNAIHLYIRSVDVEHGEHCQWDYIEVYGQYKTKS